MSSLIDRTRFREALIERMEVTGMTAVELARRSGVAKSQIDKLRQRKTETTNVIDAVVIARVFGQSVEDFMGIRSRAEKINELNQLIERLPPDVKETVLVQLRALAAVRSKPGPKPE